jgi:hypothetical protein
MAAAAPANYPDNDVGFISENILGLTTRQAGVINNNGWEVLSDFEGYSTEDITDWISATARLALNRGGCIFPTVKARKLIALNYWINRKLLRGKPLIPAEFDAAALTQALLDYPINDMMRDSTDSLDKPSAFNYDKWVDWQDSIITYLKGKKNITKNVPLYYVIRPDLPPANPSEEEDIIFHAPLTGAAFVTDNKVVHQFLTELTNGTDADNWIRPHRRTQDGRAAWQDLCAHYDGDAEGDKRVTVARHDIKIIHYRNESSFSFERYSTRLKKAFATLAQYGQPRNEKEKVETLLDQIHTSDTRLVTALGICRDGHAHTFESACTYLSKQIAIIYPQHQPNALGKAGKGGKRQGNRSINAIKKSKGGKVFANGVNLTDTTRYFSKEDFEKMGKEGRDYLYKCPKRKASREAHEARKKSKGNNSINPGNGNGSQRHIAAIINGVMQATRNENESVPGSSVPSQITETSEGSSAQMPQHGTHVRQANVSALSQSRSTRSQVRYDHNGDIVS